MDKITAIFEKIDLAKLVPPMDTLLDKLQFVAGIALMVGPLVMLVFGLWYLLLPPKEANHSAGFRTWFGMGSVEAWRMTQKIAGITWGACGLVLSVIMWFVRKKFEGMDVMGVATTAFNSLLWQVGVALVTYVAISLVIAVLYNYKGDFRWKKKAQEPAPEENPEVLVNP